MITWEVKLKNGEYKAGRIDNRSWLQLKKEVENNSLKQITELKLIARSNSKGTQELIEQNKDGFIFGNKIERVIGGPCKNYVAIGYLQGDQCHINWHEIMNDESFGQPRSEIRNRTKAKLFLITNRKV